MQIKIKDKVWVSYANGKHLGTVIDLGVGELKDLVEVKFRGIFTDTVRTKLFHKDEVELS